MDVNPQRYTIACIVIVSFPSAREVNKKLKSQQKAYETKGISSFVTCGGDKLFVHVPRTWERNDCHAGYAHHAKRYQKLINDLIMSSNFTMRPKPHLTIISYSSPLNPLFYSHWFKLITWRDSVHSRIDTISSWLLLIGGKYHTYPDGRYSSVITFQKATGLIENKQHEIALSEFLLVFLFQILHLAFTAFI